MELIMRSVAAVILSNIYGFVGATVANPMAWLNSMASNSWLRIMSLKIISKWQSSSIKATVLFFASNYGIIKTNIHTARWRHENRYSKLHKKTKCKLRHGDCRKTSIDSWWHRTIRKIQGQRLIKMSFIIQRNLENLFSDIDESDSCWRRKVYYNSWAWGRTKSYWEETVIALLVNHL